jgi:phospholipid-binding lipoprotein MlaA
MFLPGPCAGSSSFEVSVSISALDEGSQITIVMESAEPVSEGKSPESLQPVERSFSANREDEPNRITDEDTTSKPSEDESTASKPSEPEEPVGTIADPLEPVNRAFFHFNDKLYFWVLKPIATGYKTIIPEDGRIGVRNFFSNLTTPVRLVNCLLQANPKCAGTETLRFVLNTTIGVAGLFDPAKKRFNIEKQDRDFGQTLGIWGMGPVFYLDLPILGPSSLRDGLGLAVDASFNPQTYLAIYVAVVGYVNTGGWILEKINEASLTLGEYEDLKKAALDPYIAVREAYYQYRQNKIKK